MHACTKTSGLIRFYRLNTENPISRQLVDLADKISLFKAYKIVGLEPIPVLQSNLPTQVSSYEDRKRVKITRKLMTYEETVEGTPSQVKELSQGSLDLANGEATIPTMYSTESEDTSRKATRRKKALRIHVPVDTQ